MKNFIKTSFAFNSNLSTWNDPISIATREHLVNILDDLIKEDYERHFKETKECIESIIKTELEL